MTKGIERGGTRRKNLVCGIDSTPKSQLKFRNLGLDFELIIMRRNKYENLGRFSSMLCNEELDTSLDMTSAFGQDIYRVGLAWHHTRSRPVIGCRLAVGGMVIVI